MGGVHGRDLKQYRPPTEMAGACPIQTSDTGPVGVSPRARRRAGRSGLSGVAGQARSSVINRARNAESSSLSRTVRR